jgi:hypothetical protein
MIRPPEKLEHRTRIKPCEEVIAFLGTRAYDVFLNRRADRLGSVKFASGPQSGTQLAHSQTEITSVHTGWRELADRKSATP